MLAIFTPSGDAKDTSQWTVQAGFSGVASDLDANGTWTIVWKNNVDPTTPEYPWRFASAAYRNTALQQLRQFQADSSLVVTVAATGTVVLVTSTG